MASSTISCLSMKVPKKFVQDVDRTAVSFCKSRSIDPVAVDPLPFHPFRSLHLFVFSSFLFYSLVWIFCFHRQFSSAIRTVREDAISGKDEWQNSVNSYIDTFALLSIFFNLHVYFNLIIRLIVFFLFDVWNIFLVAWYSLTNDFSFLLFLQLINFSYFLF